MYWGEFLVCSVVVLVFFTVLAVLSTKTRKYKWFTPITMLTAGVILSALSLYIPIFYQSYNKLGGGLFESVYDSVKSSIDIFGFNGSLGKHIGVLSELKLSIYNGYITMFSIIFVIAPMLTVSYLLSFFNDISSYVYYIFRFNSKIYVFSELNEESYLLAKSIEENKEEKTLIIFANVVKDRKKKNILIEKAVGIGAIYFKKDIHSIKLVLHNKNRELRLFAIGADEDRNVNLSFELMKKYKGNENVYLYVFSTKEEAEYLFMNAYDSEFKLKVRRVDVVSSLVARNMYEEGYEKIFSNAVEKDGVKNINALIVGVGKYGTEMARTLPWVCQMDGYKVKINAVDIRKDTEEIFTSLCPELMEYSGKQIEGESEYELNVHSNMDVYTDSFDKFVVGLGEVTYVFVDVGEDDKNISVAIKLRTLFARQSCYPCIQAIVHNTDKKNSMTGITNHRNQQYNIDFLGDLSSCFSKKVILNSILEQKALARHLKWGKEDEFWKYSYNYNSSIASVIHRKLKKMCGMAGIEKSVDERSEEEKVNLRILEHKRWNAYVRSQGYVYGGTVEKSGRNDMAKTHNCLVSFSKLPLEEQLKDDD